MKGKDGKCSPCHRHILQLRDERTSSTKFATAILVNGQTIRCSVKSSTLLGESFKLSRNQPGQSASFFENLGVAALMKQGHQVDDFKITTRYSS